jgi:hypothetical protein
MVPIPKKNGISEGYFRPGDGIIHMVDGPGIDRGGINWNGACYRVMGTKFVRVNANWTITIIGDVGGTTDDRVSMDYGFDYLAIASDEKLWLYDGTTLAQVTDTDLGPVLDVQWVDGYFMTTDGIYLVVTDLNDPFSVNPLKYGSAETDPDPIVGILKVRNEIYAMGRYSIEVFSNIGGSLFPFARIPGAQVQRGAIGTHACVFWNETIAFLGSGRNEAPAIYVVATGVAEKISTREIDQQLAKYTEDELSTVVLESRINLGLKQLYIHLPDRTLIFDANASQVIEFPCWYYASTSLVGNSQYRARNMVWCYNQWIVSDPQTYALGIFTETLSSHWGQVVGWEFNTSIIFNESRGVLFHELELVALNGRSELGVDSTIWTSYSVDGESWSVEKGAKVGRQGDRRKNITWLRNGYARDWRIQKFRGTSDAFLSVARLEMRIEPLRG